MTYRQNNLTFTQNMVFASTPTIKIHKILFGDLRIIFKMKRKNHIYDVFVYILIKSINYKFKSNNKDTKIEQIYGALLVLEQ